MGLIARRLGVRAADHRVRNATEHTVRMRDGALLRTVRGSPQDPGPHPTILIRTPYNVGWLTPLPAMPLMARFFAGRGYHVLLQDTRGRYGSEGEFYPFVHERADGFDTLDWISGQPWFEGNLGMWGGSYFGYTQWSVADGAPPFLKALVPSVRLVTVAHADPVQTSQVTV